MAGDIKKEYRGVFSSDRNYIAYYAFKKLMYPEQELMRFVKENVLQRLDLPSGISYLDVGCGDMERTIYTGSYLSGRGIDANITGIDPGTSKLMRNARHANTYVSKMRWRFYNDTIEDFDNLSDFNLITSYHSIFALEGDSIKKMLGLLRPGGYLLAVSNTSDSFLAGMKKIADKGRGKRFEIDDLTDFLGSENLDHEDIYLENRVRLPMRRDLMESELDKVISFITLSRPVGKRLYGEIMDYAIDKVMHDNSGSFFMEKEKIVIVRS